MDTPLILERAAAIWNIMTIVMMMLLLIRIEDKDTEELHENVLGGDDYEHASIYPEHLNFCRFESLSVTEKNP